MSVSHNSMTYNTPARDNSDETNNNRPKMRMLFVVFKDNQPLIFDHYFNTVNQPLHGLYSSIHFEGLIVIGDLNDYHSHHGGLNMMLQTLSRFTAKYKNTLFAREPKGFSLPEGKPLAGGGILFFDSQIIFWHLKSGSFSQDNVNCHDDHPLRLKNLIHTLQLPQERFVTVEQAEYFEEQILREFFLSNGQYPTDDKATLQEIIKLICETLKLAPPTFQENDASLSKAMGTTG